MATSGRLVKELKECGKEDSSGVLAFLVDESNVRHLKGNIKGPEGTVYDGGIFYVDIIIPPQYPFEPPKMKFITKVFHPNISSQTGAICLDILKDKWSPALTIKSALLSLQALLSCPEPKDPQDAVVAKLYLDNYAEFERTAKYWTATYAKPVQHDDAVARIMEMGFDEPSARAALEKSNWDEEKAVNSLLGGGSGGM